MLAIVGTSNPKMMLIIVTAINAISAGGNVFDIFFGVKNTIASVIKPKNSACKLV